jgi:hypothetical protein
MKKSMKTVKDLNERASYFYFESVENAANQYENAGNEAAETAENLTTSKRDNAIAQIAGGACQIIGGVLQCMPGPAKPIGYAIRVAGTLINFGTAITDFVHEVIQNENVKPKIEKLQTYVNNENINTKRREIHYLLTKLQLLHERALQDPGFGRENRKDREKKHWMEHDAFRYGVPGIQVAFQFAIFYNSIKDFQQFMNLSYCKDGNVMKYSKWNAAGNVIFGGLEIFGGAMALKNAHNESKHI